MEEMKTLITGLSRMQIEEFFREVAPLTQGECNQMAEQIIGMHVLPSEVQGATSYTVAPAGCATGSVVQFRTGDYALDLEFLEFVRQAYGGRFVPQHRHSGRLGKLHVYTMDNVGGVSAYLARSQLRARDGYLLTIALQDFAGFFASAWHNTPPSMPVPNRHELYNDYKSQLQQLRRGLPERFHKLLDRLIENLPGLFASDWPMVPNHTDLLENNIHVDPKTGSITGICDWKDAEIGPFGTSIEGLESLLGERTTTGWRWVPNQASLRQRFWQAFAAAMGPIPSNILQRVDDARLVGIFLKHGLEWVSTESRAPVREGSSAFGYLQAVTLDLEGSVESSCGCANGSRQACCIIGEDL